MVILSSLSFNKDEERDIRIIINTHVSNLCMLTVIIIILHLQAIIHDFFEKLLLHISTEIPNCTLERLKL